MSSSREELQEALCRYTTDTLTHISTVKEFCDQRPRWVLARETELNMMTDIDTRATEYMKNQMSDSQRQELKKELAAVLKDTLGGQKLLRPFLDAVEQLSVTSLSFFKEDKQVLKLPEGIDLRNIWVVVITTRVVCPLLVEFRRDDSEFFLPRLQNVAVLMYQLDRYIRTSEKMCDILQKSCVFNVPSLQPVVDLQGLCEDDIERMLCLINTCRDIRAVLQVPSLQPVVDLQGLSDADIERMLSLIDECRDIRNDQHFRMVSLFQEDACSSFITEFDVRKLRMRQLLTELEKSADQLESKNFGIKVSSVVCSLVGALGGVLSISGLVMASWALILTGDILGVISRLSSAGTALAEFIVNCKCKVKADEIFKSFMEDVESLQDCLKTTMDRASDLDVNLVVHKVNRSVSAIGKLIDSLVDLTSAITGPTKSIRAKVSLGLLNALFVIMDIVLICTDSISLAKGRETDMSKFIRARAALWRSEVDAWEKISNSCVKAC